MLELARTVDRAGASTSPSSSTRPRRSPPSTTGCWRCSATAPSCWPATSPSWASPPTAGSRPAARARLGCGSRSTGSRAHTARPWMGRNAIHRLGGVLAGDRRLRAREPVIDGCEYREALQAVASRAASPATSSPTAATLTVNHRFAPDRTVDEAVEAFAASSAPLLEDGDDIEVVDGRRRRAPPLDRPAARPLVGAGHPGAGQAGLDRRRPLRRARHSRRPTSAPATPPSPTWPTSTSSATRSSGSTPHCTVCSSVR